MRRFRLLGRLAMASLAVVTWLVSTAPAIGGEPLTDDVVAYADGRRIPIGDVSRYYCDDFSYPVIQCSSLAVLTQTRAAVVTLLAGVDYVTIYDLSGYGGGYMNLSQDYGSLMTIGWNDKVSSFRGRNSETGRFWTDWFETGTSWSFCCNTTVPSLGSYNNTFSSVVRT